MFRFRSTVYRFGLTCLVIEIQNDFVNLGICEHKFKFTCHGYCRFTLSDCQNVFSSFCEVFSSAEEVTLPIVREFK